jgi:ComF family protein
MLLADMAYNTFNTTAKSVPDAIIPVPLHRKRLLSRGYNQSTELCRSLARRLERPVISDGLNRIKNTVPQTKLGTVERQENIKAAFDASSIRVKGKSILLVDDVYTTGATLRECTRTLKRAGTKEVNVLVLARAMR